MFNILFNSNVNGYCLNIAIYKIIKYINWLIKILFKKLRFIISLMISICILFVKGIIDAWVETVILSFLY